MPTKRPRHTVTETGVVASAFERARDIRPDIRAADLIVLGADALVDDAKRPSPEDDERRALRERFLERTGTEGLGWPALSDARARAWSREP